MLTSSGIFDQKIVFKTIGFINYTFKRNVWPTEHDKFSLDPVEITNETAITNRHNYENSLLMLCVTEDRFGISKDNFFWEKTDPGLNTAGIGMELMVISLLAKKSNLNNDIFTRRVLLCLC